MTHAAAHAGRAPREEARPSGVRKPARDGGRRALRVVSCGRKFQRLLKEEGPAPMCSEPSVCAWNGSRAALSRWLTSAVHLSRRPGLGRRLSSHELQSQSKMMTRWAASPSFAATRDSRPRFGIEPQTRRRAEMPQLPLCLSENINNGALIIHPTYPQGTAMAPPRCAPSRNRPPSARPAGTREHYRRHHRSQIITRSRPTKPPPSVPPPPPIQQLFKPTPHSAHFSLPTPSAWHVISEEVLHHRVTDQHGANQAQGPGDD